MNTFARSILTALLVTACAVTAGRALAQEGEDRSRTPSRDSAKPPEPSLEQVLERLGKVEKELLQLRIKSGAVPADKNEQRILTLIETPYLGNLQYGSSANQRFVALKLMLVNLTDQPATLQRDDVQLSVDGQNHPIKEASRDYQYRGLQIGQQQLQVRNLQMPKEINVNPGATASTWMLFQELPPGNHVPPLALRLKLGDKWRQVDLNAVQRDALGMKIERIGPRGSLALISIAGALDTINVGTLVEEIDRLTGDKVVRVVVSWNDGGSIADPQLASWLHSAVASQNRGQAGDGMFPALPASLRELHLAALPEVGNSRGIQQMYPAFSFPNPGVGTAIRQHKTQAEAVVAALRTAYESLPRDELAQAIQSGSRLERAAALVGGGGRLDADKLPVLLKLADDDDAVIQQAALLALSHFGEPAAIERLIAAARKDVPGLSTTAISGLASSRYPAAHQALLDLLHNEPPESKKNIVRLLAAYPRPIWSDAIYEFVKDGRSGLNVEALQALVQVGHPRLVAVLQEALRGGDANLAQTALGVLATRSDRESEEVSLEYTLEKLKTAPATPVMLTLLGRVKDKRAMPLLMTQFAKSENKSALIQTLALLGDGETAKFLIEKYPQLPSHEKGEIIRAVSQLDKEAFRRLAAQALTTADGSAISQAVRGLQEDGGPEAIRIMADALESAPNQSWAHLCNALAQAATPAARTALLKARDSDNREKRSYALNGLQQLRQRSPGHQYLIEAQSLSQRQKWKEAIEQFGLAIQLDPTLSDAWTERGHAWLHLDKPQEAGKDFEKGLELDPYSSLATTGACLAMIIGDGKHVEGVKRLEEARSRFPRDAMFAYNAACVYGRSYERLDKDPQSAERDKLLEHYRQMALADLKASIQGGFQDFDLMKSDPDLAPFRESSEFKQLLTAPPTPEGQTRGPRRGANVRP